jgi:hypothetical protein
MCLSREEDKRICNKWRKSEAQRITEDFVKERELTHLNREMCGGLLIHETVSSATLSQFR